MIKSKRRANKLALINDSRRYTIVSNDDGYGGTHHYFPLGTVVRKTGDGMFEEVSKSSYPLIQGIQPRHFI